jgi:4-hydroxy-3-polyprenylbenzoate decarboxylase
LIGINGATGAIYGIRMLQVVSGIPDVETHLVISPAGERTIEIETEYKAAQVKTLADHWYRFDDIGACLASGSFQNDGMIIAPCSMKSLSAIAHSYADNLLTRAADVALKERRRLVLLVRETPLHLGHLKNMISITEMGGIIMPPVPAFYHKPHTILDIVDHTVGKRWVSSISNTPCSNDGPIRLRHPDMKPLCFMKEGTHPREPFHPCDREDLIVCLFNEAGHIGAVP